MQQGFLDAAWRHGSSSAVQHTPGQVQQNVPQVSAGAGEWNPLPHVSPQAQEEQDAQLHPVL